MKWIKKESIKEIESTSVRMCFFIVIFWKDDAKSDSNTV